MTQGFSTPVAFFIFNRPETTRRVFAAIREARPGKLLVVADGPRTDREGEAEKCALTRAVVAGVDWPCEVLTDFSEKNLGCRRRLSSGMSWVFSQVEEAVILEDDCLPHPSFFPYCELLLERYRHDDRVMMISGDNFQFGRRRTPYSYYFTRYPHIWGWATWRRAWATYDPDLAVWPQARPLVANLFHDRAVADFWRRAWDGIHSGAIDTWDYQLVFAALAGNRVCIVPEENLVSNIGFGADATRTTGSSPLAEMPVCEMKLPLQHPPCIFPMLEADAFIEQQQFVRRSLLRRVLARVAGA